MKWFEVGHGIDNYEEHIDLSQVCFIRCGFEFLPNNKDSVQLNEMTGKMEPAPMWDYQAEVMFVNGQTVKIHFNEYGYKEFLKELKKVKQSEILELANAVKELAGAVANDEPLNFSIGRGLKEIAEAIEIKG